MYSWKIYLGHVEFLKYFEVLSMNPFRAECSYSSSNDGDFLNTVEFINFERKQLIRYVTFLHHWSDALCTALADFCLGISRTAPVAHHCNR